MSRCFSNANAKAVSALITNKISDAIARRGYAYAYAAASGSGSGGEMARVGAPNVMLKKKGSTNEESAWVPDPKTGYYRPENHAKEIIDAAEILVTRRS